MKSLTIKDLEMNKELNGADLAAVRGGSNFGFQGGQSVAGGGVLSIGSPVIAVNVPTLTQTDIHPVTNIDLNLANIIASAGTLVGQA
jgi:hypothetical protein